MANVCLPPKVIDGFKAALVSGKIKPEQLANMTSEARHQLFSDVVGEGNAKFVNSEFESKLLLKNQQRGFITWAQNVAGLKPDVRRDLISRIERMDKVLNPAEEKQFLKDLASTKLGMDVTALEARQITNLSKRMQEAAAKQRPDGTFPTEADRFAYGRAKTDLGQLVGDLKNHAENPSIGQMLKNPKETAIDIGSHPIKLASRIGGTAKSVKAAFDDSALLRQGWKTLLTHPVIWGKNVRKNIDDLYKQGIKGEDVMREVKADIVSRPNAQLYEKMGIAPKVEEEFGDPSLVIKIPGVGRVYKTTEVAFNAFMLRNRADLADYYIDLAKKAGANINDPKELKSIGKMIGGLTGRGDLGSLEHIGNTTNNIFFSPRFVKSQIDTVLHPITGAGGSNFVRKQAAINLVKVVGMTAAIFGTANAIRPGSVELDPRSSNFGKLKVGDTTFDLTGGFSSIAVLAARLTTHQYKSNSKGVISELGSNPAIPSGTDLISSFVSGKLSPAAQRAWVHIVTHKEYSGAAPTPGSDAYNLFTPLPFSTYTEAAGDPHGANPIATEMADAFGLSANTNNPASFDGKLPKADQALKDKIGGKQFKQYQQDYNDRLTTFLSSDQYKKLSDDQKVSGYTSAERKIKKNLYKSYGFTPPKSTSVLSNSERKSLLDSIK